MIGRVPSPRFAWGAALSIVVAGFAGFSCATTSGTAETGETCTFSTDCLSGLACIVVEGKRQCSTLRSPVNQSCATDRECAPGQACKAGRCGVAPSSVILGPLEDRCEDDDDCQEGRSCNRESNRCQPIPAETKRCSSAWDCSSLEQCSFGVCERQSPLSGCRSDLDCGGFARCILGRCQ